jgi:hypothetical protein
MYECSLVLQKFTHLRFANVICSLVHISLSSYIVRYSKLKFVRWYSSFVHWYFEALNIFGILLLGYMVIWKSGYVVMEFGLCLGNSPYKIFYKTSLVFDYVRLVLKRKCLTLSRVRKCDLLNFPL